MITYNRSINSDLLAFWYEYASPGRIGLLKIDVVTARLIGWIEHFVTLDREPSPWAHAFFFIRSRHGVPWIAESDLNVPLPGYRPKPNGPQENPIYKWSHPAVTRCAVLDLRLSDHDLEKLDTVTEAYIKGNYTYRISELAEAAVALMKGDLSRQALSKHEDSMHCTHFLRACLRDIGRDPFDNDILLAHTTPEHFSQAYPTIAEWNRRTDT